MALTRSTFTRGGTSVTTGPGIHTYTTPDAKATVVASGYFNDLAKTTEGPIIAVGDFILTQYANGGTTLGCILMVNSISAGVVTVVSSAAFS